MYDERGSPEIIMSAVEFNSLPMAEDKKKKSGWWNRCRYGYRFTVGDTDDGLVGMVVPADRALPGQKVDRQLVNRKRTINYYRPVLVVSE